MKRLILYVIPLLVAVGCLKTMLPEPAGTPSQDVFGLKQESAAVATDLHAQAKAIKAETTAIRAVTPPEAAPKVIPHAAAIDASADKVEADAARVDAKLTAQLDGLKKEVEAVEKERDAWKAKYDDEAAQHKKDMEAAQSRIRNLIAGIAAFGLFLGIAAAVVNTFTARLPSIYACAAACLAASLSAMIFDAYYHQIVLLALGVFIVGVVGVLIVFIMKHRGENLFKSAATELVKFGEVVKQEVSRLGTVGEAVRAKLFGDGILDSGLAGQVLSPKTQGVIKEIRTSGNVKLAA